MKKLLKSNRYLEEIQCKSMIYDILCGLTYLHRNGICHRDLKPDNILVNDDCTIQICDFGLSRSLKGIEDEGDFYEDGMLTKSNASNRGLKSTTANVNLLTSSLSKSNRLGL